MTPTDGENVHVCDRSVALVNERVALRAAVWRMWDALLTIEEQAMTLLHGRTDAWPLIDAIEKAQAAYGYLAEQYPEPYQDDEAMLRMAGNTADVRGKHPDPPWPPQGDANGREVQP